MQCSWLSPRMRCRYCSACSVPLLVSQSDHTSFCVVYMVTVRETVKASVSQASYYLIRYGVPYISLGCSVTIPCHFANNNTAHTSTVLRKLLLAFHTDPATLSELERFSHHVALRKFKFTVFGFLSLDLSLLVSMMGAVVTYLVILMQFKINTN